MANEIFLGTRALLAKREVTYSVDPVPVVATDAVLLRNITVTPLELSYAERELILPYFGNVLQLPTNKLVKITAELEMAGFGTAGPVTPTPGYDALVRACAITRTITAGVKVDYTPITESQDSAALYYFHGKRLHKVLGVRGSLGLKYKVDTIPTFTLEMVGLDGGISDVGALPAPVLTGYVQPVISGPLTTTPFTIHGLATAALEELTVQLGTTPVLNRLINAAEEVRITGRKVAGSIQIQDHLVAIKNWFTTIGAATLGALDITHGTVAGNIVQFAAPNTQLTDPRLVEKDGVSHLQMALRMLPSGTGNNEFTITVK